MIRFCIRQAVRVFAGAAFFACALSAHAANITFNDPNCASFSITGSGGNYQLVCASLSCSITSSAGATITPGNGTNLTATCSPAATGGVTWSAGPSNDPACPAVPAANTSNPLFIAAPLTGQSQPATVNGCVYQVAANGGSNGNGSASTSVSWTSAPPVTPTGCVITANQNPLPVGGGNVTLTASCATGNNAVASWTNWTGPIATATGNTATAALTQAASFTATANGAFGSITTPPLTVSVQSAGSGGGTNCSQVAGSGITGATSMVTMLWPNWLTNQNGNMGPNDALILKFSTGPTASSQTGKIVLFSGSGQDSAHDAYVSTQPCDFGQLSTKTLLPALKFTVGTKVGTVPMLQLNTTYYVNIKNSVDAVCLTPGLNITCSLVNGVSLYKPAGL